MHLEQRDSDHQEFIQITVGIFSFVFLVLVIAGMVFCWKNTQVRRWIGDCTPWRRKQQACNGQGEEGAGDLENAREVITPIPTRDLRSELHTPTYSELAQEKELRQDNAENRFSIFSRHTTVPEPAASFGGLSPQPSLSRAERALRYVTKDTQQYLFPDIRPERCTPATSATTSTTTSAVASPVASPIPSPRKYSFRSARALRKGSAPNKLTISAPIYGEFPALTLSLPPMNISWPHGYDDDDQTIKGSQSCEPSPSLSVPFTDRTDRAETLSSFASEEVPTIDYYHNDAFTRQHFGDFENRRKRLSNGSQFSGISIMSTDTGRISLAQVAMRPESRPTLQIIGPCESPRRVVVVHY